MTSSSSPVLGLFRVVKRIAVGGFGILEEGVGPDGEKVAIKMERTSPRVTRSSLAHEYKIYEILEGHPRIPRTFAYGKHGNFNVMAMELLGATLGDRFRQCGKKFTLQTSLMLGLGMLDALEYIHSKGIIHRDVKPDNFLFGDHHDDNTIYPIDFGLARRYRDPRTGTHFTYSDGMPLMGTLIYASLGVHLGQAQSRRDDLQSLAYILIQFIRGSLPWENVRGGTQRHREWRIREKKRSWTSLRLCEGLPKELEVFTEHCLKLGWNENPRYDILREAIGAVMSREGWKLDHHRDWKACVPLAPLEPIVPYVQYEPKLPLIQRGDLVLLQLLARPSLEYEAPPRIADQSYYSHPDLSRDEWRFPFRPAVVRAVTPGTDTFKLDIYPLMRRPNGLEKISPHRRNLFIPLPANSTSVSISENMYIYRTSLEMSLHILNEQACSVKAQCSLDETALGEAETVLKPAPCPYSKVYDSDDEETQAIRSSMPRTWRRGDVFVARLASLSADDLCRDRSDINWTGSNGWMSDVIAIDHKRREENDDLSCDEDSESDSDISWFDGPKPGNRRGSCTLS